jgi:hypothetical protein
MGQFMGQIRLATFSGLKGKDDCLDTISMLANLNPWRPSDSAPATPDEVSLWDDEEKETADSGMSSYIV